MSKAKQELDGTLVAGETWSTPICHNGADGSPGLSPINASASPPAQPVACTFNGPPKASIPGFHITLYQGDRKSGLWGKRLSERLDPGCSCTIKKKKTIK